MEDALSLLDPDERSRGGLQRQTELTGATPAEPATLLESTWRDFVFAEVWARPGLDRRARFYIAMSGAACANAPDEVVDGYVRGAMTLGDATQEELREAALHIAVYNGWTVGGVLDRAVTRVSRELGQPMASYTKVRSAPWDPDERLVQGAANFRAITTTDAPPRIPGYFQNGILNFVFGEMWTRPGLDQKARRWVTLVGVGHSSTDIPIRSHVYSAMASGDASFDEMKEFVLQYAVHAGWPRGSVMQAAVFDMAAKLEKGLPFSP
jgi:4-carboxymuconolactone decarboxylase